MKFNSMDFEKTKDMFGFYRQITEINQGFRLYFNKKVKKLIIVNVYRNYEICSIFDNILEININNLRFLKIENSKNIFNVIEENNLKLENKLNIKNKEILSYATSEIIKINNRSTSIKSNDKNKILGAIKC